MTTGPDGAGGMFAPLKYPVFAALWLTSLGTSFGMMVQTMAAAWLMMSLSHSTVMVGAIQSAASLPVALLALLAGAIADAFDRRKVMLVAQMLSLSASGMLAGFAFAGSISPAMLLVFTLLIAVGYALNLPTWQSSIRLLVPAHAVPAAVNLNAIGFNIARSLAPALGGFLLARGSAAGAFLFNSLTYCGVIIVLLFWRPKEPERSGPREPVIGSIVSGVRYMAFSPPLRAILAHTFLFTLCGSCIWAFLPLIARTLLGGDISTYAQTLVWFGVGAIIGGIAGSAARLRLGARRTALLAGIAMPLAIAGIGASSVGWLSFPLLLIAGMLWVVMFTTLNVNVQMLAPIWLTGRALASYQTLVFAGLAIGSLAWSALSTLTGLRFALAIAAVAYVVGLAIFEKAGLRVPEGEAPPAEPAPLPLREPAMALLGETAELVVTLRYRVAEEDQPDFTQILRQVGRLRLRDGANHWEALQDIDAPEIWTEVVRFRDWDSYQRHAQRLTSDSVELRLSLGRYDTGGKPEIRRQLSRK